MSYIKEYEGSGFIMGIPTSVATAPCRIKFSDQGAILEVVPPGQPFSDEHFSGGLVFLAEAGGPEPLTIPKGSKIVPAPSREDNT